MNYCDVCDREYVPKQTFKENKHNFCDHNCHSRYYNRKRKGQPTQDRW